MVLMSVVDRARSKSYIRWRFNQKSGVIPKACPRRSAVSAVMDLRQVDDIVDAYRRHAHCLGQTVLGDPQLVHDLRQMFAGVDRFDSSHACPPQW